MRGFLIIIWTLVLLWNIAGNFMRLDWEFRKAHSVVKEQVESDLETKHAKILFFTHEEMTQLIWVKSNEFKWNNRFFDVLKSEQTAGGVELTCISDKKETALMAELNSLISDRLLSEKQNAPLKHHVKCITSEYLMTTQPRALNWMKSIMRDRKVHSKNPNQWIDIIRSTDELPPEA